MLNIGIAFGILNVVFWLVVCALNIRKPVEKQPAILELKHVLHVVFFIGILYLIIGVFATLDTETDSKPIRNQVAQSPPLHDHVLEWNVKTGKLEMVKQKAE